MRIVTLLLFAISAWAADGQRIISTAPSITETLFAMGLGPRVVGDTIYCNFPEAAAKLPRIGTLLKPDPEASRRFCGPDLVVGAASSRTICRSNWIASTSNTSSWIPLIST